LGSVSPVWVAAVRPAAAVGSLLSDHREGEVRLVTQEKRGGGEGHGGGRCGEAGSLDLPVNGLSVRYVADVFLPDGPPARAGWYCPSGFCLSSFREKRPACCTRTGNFRKHAAEYRERYEWGPQGRADDLEGRRSSRRSSRQTRAAEGSRNRDDRQGAALLARAGLGGWCLRGAAP